MVDPVQDGVEAGGNLVELLQSDRAFVELTVGEDPIHQTLDKALDPGRGRVLQRPGGGLHDIRQRVEAFAMDQWKDGGWNEFAKGTSIGNRRLLRFEPLTTSKVRLRITQAAVCPALSELGLHAEPIALRP